MSDEYKGQSEETTIPAEEALSEQSEQPLKSEEEVPEKFAGKPAHEVIRAYQELERKLGGLASEKAQERQRAEVLEARLRDLEARSYQPQQHYSQPRQEEDPVALLDSPEWEQDPRAVIKKSMQGITQRVRQEVQQQQAYRQYNEMMEYYSKQKQENPDFARREAIMQQLATQLAGVVKPEALNSLPVLKALDLMSKGMDISYYEQQAIERAKKDGLSRREEKRNAYSESSGSPSASHGKRAKDMSVEELEALLKASEQDE